MYAHVIYLEFECKEIKQPQPLVCILVYLRTITEIGFQSDLEIPLL